MFLTEPAESPADLRFWLFGTHVRVHPIFWLLAAVLGWGLTMGEDTRTGLLYLAVWVACVFVSVLLHEFGHIFMGRVFGSHGHIVLYSFGGLAIGSSALDRGWQRFLVSLAGPLIQFVFFGVVFLATLFLLPQAPAAWQRPVSITAAFLLEINLFWPILNLLPIWPLDGGQMTREVATALSPASGVYASMIISACVSGLLALHCFFPKFLGDRIPFLSNFGGMYMGIFFALFCAQSIMALQAENSRRQRYRDDEFPWER